MNATHGKTLIDGNLKHIIKWSFSIQLFDNEGRFYIRIVYKDNRMNEDFSNSKEHPQQYLDISTSFHTDTQYEFVFDTIRGDKMVVNPDLLSSSI